MIDLPASALWLPPKPAIVRASTLKEASFLPGMFPAMVMAGDRPPVTVERTDDYTEVGNVLGESSFSTSSVSFGTASSDRVIALTLFAGSRGLTFDDGRVASITIGGVSASLANRVLYPQDIGEVSIWYAPVPTGTTGNIVINLVDEVQMVNVQVFAVRCPGAVLYATTVAGPTETTGNGSDSLDQTTIKGAGLVGVLGRHAQGTLPTYTLSWTGLSDPLSTDCEIDTVAGFQRLRICAAYESNLAAGAAPRTLTAAWSSGSLQTFRCGSVVAQFRPA